MSIVFHSKSAYKSNNNKVVLQKLPKFQTKAAPSVVKDYIVWLGSSFELQNFGKLLGYTNLDAETLQDISMLVDANALILTQFIDDRCIKFLNFAGNYGVPTVWINTCIVPHKWMWSFQLCFTGNVSAGEFWSEVCKIIK